MFMSRDLSTPPNPRMLVGSARGELETCTGSGGLVAFYRTQIARPRNCGSPWLAYSQARGRFVLVGGTGIEPATSSVSGKRATAAPTAHWCGLVEVETGFEPV